MPEAVINAVWTANLDRSQLPLPRPVSLSSGVVLTTDGESVYAFRPDTGARVWKTPATMMIGGFVASGPTIYITDGGLIRALRATDGSELWRYENTGPPRPNLRPPVVAGATVIAIDRGGALHAVSASGGRELWVRQYTNSVTSPLAADAQTAYYAGDGALRAIDAASGALKWSFTPQDAGMLYVDSWIAVAGGWIFTSFGQGYALDATQGQPLPNGPKTFANGPGNQLTGLAVDADQGITLYGDGQSHAFAHRYWTDITAFFPDQDGAFQPGAPAKTVWPVWYGKSALLCLKNKYANQTELTLAVPDWGRKTLTVTSSMTLGQVASAPPVVSGGIVYLLTDGDPATQTDEGFQPQLLALRLTT